MSSKRKIQALLAAAAEVRTELAPIRGLVVLGRDGVQVQVTERLTVDELEAVRATAVDVAARFGVAVEVEVRE